ncbi:cobalt ECF transporter T component CbiQ [Paenibacillus methanolicus]|uniref:Cobalt/nickel transport system permease protein n=1 Tax=Paenibacillus methanolicus TaxID=582686 RepID=A0A5S5CM02_9BACL|nr:cobalt ECF transporter T component CbiQ [Paenibacillus methanolicus]TYP79531.1 cobalt/nickel transport system permease protein [Paenibacillus methanolicus]
MILKQIDSYSYGNRLRSLPATAKCGFAAALLLLAYLAGPAEQAAIVAWLFSWTVIRAGIGARFYAAALGSVLGFYLLSLPALLVEVMPEGAAAISGAAIRVDIGHWQLVVTDEGGWLAVRLMFRILACSSCFLFVILTTPMADLFHVLRKLRVPQLVLEIMQIMYRFLFLLLQTAVELYMAQRARGGYRGAKRTIADTATLAARLFSRTMSRYEGWTRGLRARGFEDELRLAPAEPGTVPARLRIEAWMGIAILTLTALTLPGGWLS